MKQSESLLRRKKRQKQEDTNDNSTINYKSEKKEELETSEKGITFERVQNKNIVRQHLQSQINGRYNQHGNQLITNKINDKGFTYSRNLVGHWGCVNAINFSNGDGRLLCSGSDDKRVLVWETFGPPNYAPVASLRGHLSNIFSTIFTHSNRFILSCGNDDTIIRYDIEKTAETLPNAKEPTIAPLQMFMRHGAAVYKVSALPGSDEIFTSASEDGTVRLWDARTGTNSIGVIPGSSPYQGVDFHPRGTFFATANTTLGVELWDMRVSFLSESAFRRPRSLITYNTGASRDVTTAVFNKTGDKLIATVRKTYPMVFETHSAVPHSIYYDTNYRNKCTMKSCVFIGANDEYVISGSDDFKLYIWQIPSSQDMDDQFANESKFTETVRKFGITSYVNETPKQILTGHRSIVNNVKYHPAFPLLASSGVEKVIKFWSPFPTGDDLANAPTSRHFQPLFKSSDYAALFQDFDFIDRGSDEEYNTEESSKTLALFDFFNQYEASTDDDLEDCDEDDDDEQNLLANPFSSEDEE